MTASAGTAAAADEGLAAAVPGETAGVQAAIVIEHEVVGGQAGTSSMIRNYPGFSQGIIPWETEMMSRWVEFSR